MRLLDVWGGGGVLGFGSLGLLGLSGLAETRSPGSLAVKLR